jgi:tetratricopeptide (TPR) repeat protein
MLFKERNFTIHAEHSDRTHHKSDPRWRQTQYLRQVKAHLQAGRQEDAFELLHQAILCSPNEPVLLSYYGYLLVFVEKMYRMGIETCQKAIQKLIVQGSSDEEELFPVLYCNLGKAYAAAGKRNEALKAFKKGLAYDSENCDIMNELRSMGIRSMRPVIPFLDRSNPLNKYIGLRLHKKKTTLAAKKKAAGHHNTIGLSL